MIESIALGILQGITEFLPVSSSGHIFYIGAITKYPVYNLPLMISIHVGTALAIIFYFKNRIKKMLLSLLKIKHTAYAEERRLWKYLLIASVPAGIAGITMEPIIEKITTVYLTGLCWIINGIILICGEFLSQKKTRQKSIDISTSVTIGIFQAIAILPGISRSGSTIMAARNTGIKPSESFEFSFLLGIIAIIGGFFLEILKKPEGFDIACLISGIIAFLSGYIALVILAKAVNLNKMKWFGYYTTGLGLFVLLRNSL